MILNGSVNKQIIIYLVKFNFNSISYLNEGSSGNLSYKLIIETVNKQNGVLIAPPPN